MTLHDELERAYAVLDDIEAVIRAGRALNWQESQWQNKYIHMKDAHKFTMAKLNDARRQNEALRLERRLFLNLFYIKK